MQEYETEESKEVLKLIFEHRTEIKQTKRPCVYIDVRIYTHGLFQSPGVRKKLPVAGSADTEIQYIISEKCIFKS